MKKTNKTARQVQAEIIQDISDKFVACLEKGEIPWRKPWNATNSGFIKSDGKSYSFLNSFLLAMQGNSPSEFVTLKEIEARTKTSAKDGSVWAFFNRDKDGKIPKSSVVYFYTRIEFTRKDADGKPLLDDDGNEVKGFYPFLKASHVWEVGRQVNCPKKFDKPIETFVNNPIAKMEEISIEYLSREGIGKETNGSEAYYSPSRDIISLPPMEQFHSSEAYYDTLFHEEAHSTGHDKRLKRDLSKRGKTDYSFEELVAEITSCMILHDNGIATEETDKNNEAYVQNWAKSLRCDPNMVEKACRQAVKAANFIYGK